MSNQQKPSVTLSSALSPPVAQRTRAAVTGKSKPKVVGTTPSVESSSASASAAPKRKKADSSSAPLPEVKAPAVDITGDLDTFIGSLGKKDRHWVNDLKSADFLGNVEVSNAQYHDCLVVGRQHALQNKGAINPASLYAIDQVQRLGALVFCWLICELLGILPAVFKAVVKLCSMYVTFNDLKEDAGKAFVQEKCNPNYGLNEPVSVFLSLLMSDKNVHKRVRILHQSRFIREAKIPEEVVRMNADVSAISATVRETRKAAIREFEVARLAFEAAKDKRKAVDEELTVVSDFVQEYNSVRSGRLTEKERLEVSQKYYASQEVQSKYTVEKFMQLFAAHRAGKLLSDRLESFRTSQGYLQGLGLVQQRPRKQNADDAEVEDMEEASGSGVSDAVDDFIAATVAENVRE